MALKLAIVKASFTAAGYSSSDCQATYDKWYGFAHPLPYTGSDSTRMTAQIPSSDSLVCGSNNAYETVGLKPYLNILFPSAAGHVVDVIDSVAVHNDTFGGHAVKSYYDALFTGHDEYWTSTYRDNLVYFVQTHGGTWFKMNGNTGMCHVTWDGTNVVLDKGHGFLFDGTTVSSDPDSALLQASFSEVQNPHYSTDNPGKVGNNALGNWDYFYWSGNTSRARWCYATPGMLGQNAHELDYCFNPSASGMTILHDWNMKVTTNKGGSTPSDKKVLTYKFLSGHGAVVEAGCYMDQQLLAAQTTQSAADLTPAFKNFFNRKLYPQIVAAPVTP